MTPAIWVVLYLAVVNLAAFAAMLLDKAAAARGARRIPEATLLQLAFAGGSLGTVLAQRTIRHKTRKEPFRTRLIAILALQGVLLVLAAFAIVLAGSPAALLAAIAV